MLGGEETEAMGERETQRAQRYPETERDRDTPRQRQKLRPSETEVSGARGRRNNKDVSEQTLPPCGPEGGLEPHLWGDGSRSRPEPCPFRACPHKA